jgi:perosamine synthetase
VLSVLRSGRLVSGPVVASFEEAIGKYIGARNVVAVNSGTAALHLSLLTSNVSAGHEVITTPFSFAATANTIIQTGAKSVFVDVNPETFNIDTQQIEKAVTKKTAAIEPVHVFGEPVEMNVVQEIAEKHDLHIVEDAAEAIGAEYHGKKIGNTEEFACFSTYATKNLHTGEGGFVTTNNDEAAATLRILRSQGQKSKYLHVKLGFNYRMTELSAAIGLVQVKKIEQLNQKRIENANLLTSKIRDLSALTPQAVIPNVKHIYYQYTVRIDEKSAGMSRGEFQKKLTLAGIETDVHWPTPIHLQPWYRESFQYKPGMFPNAEKLAETVVSLPIHPFLTREEIEFISDNLHAVLGR